MTPLRRAANGFGQLWRAAGTRVAAGWKWATAGVASLILDSKSTRSTARKDAAEWLETYAGHPVIGGIVGRISEDCGAASFNVYQPEEMTPPERHYGGETVELPGWVTTALGLGPRTRYTPSGLYHNGVAVNRLLRDKQGRPHVRSGIGQQSGVQGEPVDTHPALSLLRNPNPEMDGAAVRQLLTVYQEILGEWYVLKDRDAQGRVVELWPCPPTWVRGLPTFDKPWFTINIGGKDWRVPRSEVCWYRRLHPAQPYSRGLGLAMTANDEVAASEMAAKWNAMFFTNSARPDIALVMEERIASIEEADKIRETWAGKHQGFWNAFKVAIVGGKLKDIKVLGSGHKDMDFPALQKNTADQLRMLWNMPGSVVGLMDDSNRSNSQTAKQNYAERILVGRLCAQASTWNRDLLPEWGEEYPGAWLEFENPVPGALEEDAGRAERLFGSGLASKNEARIIAGLPPDEHGDHYLNGRGVYPWLYYPSNTPPPPGGLNLEAELSTELSGKLAVPHRKILALPAPRGIVRVRNVGDVLLRALVERTEPHEPGWRKMLRRLFEAQRAEVLDGVGRLKALKKDVEEDIIAALFDIEEWAATFEEQSRPRLRDIVEESGQDAVDAVGGGTFDLDDPAAKAFLKGRAQRFAREVNETTWQRLKDSLAEGMSAGESITELEQRVSDVFDIAVGSRSQLIARTEVVGASNGGALIGYQQSGVERKAWLTAHDDRVRDTHIAAGTRYTESEPIGIDEDFEVGIGAGPAPGQIGVAAEDCNCVIGGDTPVNTPSGTKPIRDIQVGDQVITHRGIGTVSRLAPLRLHSGPVLTICTGDGLLNVTLNHPILTDQGWVVAGEVQEGSVIFAPSLIQRRDLIVQTALLGVDEIVNRTTSSSCLTGEAVDQLGELPLDDKIGKNLSQQQCGVATNDLPSVHGGPVFHRGLLAAVHAANARDGYQKANESGVRVGHDDPRLNVPFTTWSSGAVTGQGDNPLPIDHRSDVGPLDLVHLSPRIVTAISISVVHEEILYNFAVDGDESYCAGNIVVHNCRCTVLPVVE